MTVYRRSPNGYGWTLDFGKRVRWNSRKATSRMWPRIHLGADEVCNRAVTLVLWPLGHLDVWWEPKWRTRNCDKCRAENLERGCCVDCGCRPCGCADWPPLPPVEDAPSPYRSVDVVVTQPNDIDLFAGPGGWDEAAQYLGLRPVGIEWDDAACRTAKAAGHTRVRADVATIATEPMVGKVRGLIASPPCQTFSNAGKGAGRDALPELQDAVEDVWKGATPQSVCPPDLDPRSVLVLEPVRYARDLRPEWIACEQVPAVLPIWRAFAVWLRQDGYSVWTGVLNSADYGVPQTRQRAILIASRVRTVQPPAPTHCKGGSEADLFGEAELPWVSMATALGWGMHPRPSVTVTAGQGRQGGPDPLDGGSGARETIRRERDAGRWAYKVPYGDGMVERHGDREAHPADEPAPVITSKARSAEWVVRTGNNSMVTGRTGSRAGDGDVQPYERSIDEPAPTVDCGAGSKWTFVSAGATGEGRPKDPETQPADTLTGKGTAYWLPADRLNDQSGSGDDGSWVLDRPATVIATRDLATHPGANANRFNDSDKSRNDGIRVTVQEAALLQSFPADYPWQGSKSKQFEQVGNAVPPLLALHVLAAVLGLPVPVMRHDDVESEAVA